MLKRPHPTLADRKKEVRAAVGQLAKNFCKEDVMAEI